jgi:hypothetical protein
MSTDLGGVFKEFVGYDDPKEIELVEKIAEKTRMGKIVWQRASSSLVATAPGMQLSFVRSSVPIEGMHALKVLAGGWEIFSIRSESGAEIMKVEQPSNLAYFGIPESTPPPRSKLLEAVDALYSAASSRGQGTIDKALEVIKNL